MINLLKIKEKDSDYDLYEGYGNYGKQPSFISRWLST